MNPLEEAFRRAVADLDELRRPYALVGGFAVGVRAAPRLTLDVDVAVAVDGDPEAERLVQDLVQRGYSVEATVEQERTGRLATVRLRSPFPEGVLVDLLFASSGIEPEVVAGAEAVEVIPGLTVPVASVGHLIAMKLLARDDRSRPADADDLIQLAALADDADWHVASDSVARIHERNSNRGRDLVAALQRLRSTETGVPSVSPSDDDGNPER